MKTERYSAESDANAGSALFVNDAATCSKLNNCQIKTEDIEDRYSIKL